VTNANAEGIPMYKVGESTWAIATIPKPTNAVPAVDK
jgi:hypothetical protein